MMIYSDIMEENMITAQKDELLRYSDKVPRLLMVNLQSYNKGFKKLILGFDAMPSK